MKRILRKFQQGDVVMHQVTDETYHKVYDKNVKSSNQERKRVCQYKGNSEDLPILALGEATGHKHKIDMKELLDSTGVRLSYDWNGKEGEDTPETMEITGESIILTHEEHNPITVPPGKYIVKIVKEFDHITGRSSYVAD